MIAKLFKSIAGNDWYILAAAVLTLVLLIVCLLDKETIKQYVQNWSGKGTLDFSKYLHRRLKIFYNLFITMISIFPLLGMFGTVKGLLMMNFATGDMGAMKQNFFGALTSTAWGIIFSILFKLVHASCRNDIEMWIEESEKMEQKAGKPKGKKEHRIRK